MSSTPELGRTLGRYELIRRIATGGMAEVYLARAAGIAQFEKLVVIKRMLPHLARDPAFIEMFLAEARIAARLDHPNIVRVEDIGEDGDNFFLVMEYVRGSDLLRVMQTLSKQGRAIPVESAVVIAAGVCAGLACAHELAAIDGKPLEIVHRDVSLPNILVSYDGAVKLADFGVAQVSDRQRTKAGVLKGKLGYMSPEQCRGKRLDLRSDIFSLGIVLYEITTGERVFGGASDFSVMEKVVQCAITPPSELMADYPPELEAIVMTALQRERENRYQTARDMQVDLEAFLRAHRMTGSTTGVGELVQTIVPVGTKRRSEPIGQIGSVGRDSSEERALRGSVAPAETPHSPPSLIPRLTSRLPIAAAGAAVLLGMIVCAWAALSSVHDPGAEPPIPGPSNPEITITSTHLERPDVVDEVRAPKPRTAPKAKPAPPAKAETTKSEPVAKPAVAAKLVPPARPARPPVRVAVAAPIARAKPKPAPRIAEIEEKPAELPAPQPPPPPEPVVVEDEPPPVRDAGIPEAPPRRPAVVDVGSLDATPRIAAVDVRGPLPGSAVRIAVERIFPALRACYHAAAKARGATVATSFQLVFEIGETRVAREVRTSGGLPGLAGCARGAAGQIRSRLAPDVGDVNVAITIELTPR